MEKHDRETSLPTVKYYDPQYCQAEWKEEMKASPDAKRAKQDLEYHRKKVDYHGA